MSEVQDKIKQIIVDELGVELLDVVCSANGTQKRAPGRRHIVTNCRYQSEPCYYYSTPHISGEW